MAVEIVDRFSGDKVMSPANQSLVRELSIGSSWTEIMVGIQYCCPQDSATAFTATQLFIGICNAAGGGYGVASPGHVVGHLAIGDFGYASGTGIARLNAPTGSAANSRRVLVESGSYSDDVWGSNAGNRTAIIGALHDGTAVQYWTSGFYYFRRVASTIEFDWARFNGTTSTNISQSNAVFDSIMEIGMDAATIASTYTNYARPSVMPVVATVDEGAHGAFNAVNFACNKTSGRIEMKRIRVTRIS